LLKRLRPYLSFVSLVVVVGCGSQPSAIKMKGSDTEVNLVVNLAEAYKAQEKDFSISITGGGSGFGIASLLNGQSDIANSSRPLNDYEKQLFEEKKIPIETIVFSYDAVAFIVNEQLPLDSLTTSELAELFNGRCANWKCLFPSELPVTIYGRQSNSGTHSYISQKLNIEFTPLAKEMNGNAQIIDAVRKDASSIGYVGAGYVYIPHHREMIRGIKVLKIAKDSISRAYSPFDQAAIDQNLYFFKRPLYQFVNAKSYDKVKPLLDFEKSKQGQDIILKNGYYPLPIEQ
jgi:phosphate transport system substrate-binding protein